MTTINYTNGTASNEQDLITVLDTFLTGTCGWTKIGTTTDTSSDRDYTYKSVGSVSGKYRDLYLRFRGYNNTLYIYTYTAWFSSSVKSDEISVNAPTGSSYLNYWFFGNQDWVWVLFANAGIYSCFGGYIDSFYDENDDDLPVAVVGQSSSSTALAGGSRIYMYNPFFISSGTNTVCTSFFPSTLLSYGSPNSRDASIANYPVTVIRATTYSEVMGTLPGILYFYGSVLTSGSWYTVSGTTDKFFIQRTSDTNCYGFGPIPV